MTNIQDLMISAQVMVGLMQRLILHISLVSFLLECLAARLPSDTWALIELLEFGAACGANWISSSKFCLSGTLSANNL